MKKALGVLFALLLTVWAQTEQLYIFSHQDWGLVNPAYAGQKASVGLWTGFHDHWAGFKASPYTTDILATVGLEDFLPRVPLGMGLRYQYDILGNVASHLVLFPLSYRLSFIPARAGFFFIGIGFRLQYVRLQSVFKPEEQGDVLVPETAILGYLPFNFDAGIAYQYQDKLFVGLTLEHALVYPKSQELAVFNPKKQNYLVQVSAYFPLDQRQVNRADHVLRWHNLVGANRINVNGIFSLDYLIKQWVYLGFSYRLETGSGLMLGLEHNFEAGPHQVRLHAGYAAEYTWAFRRAASFSQEVSIGLHWFFHRQVRVFDDQFRVKSSRHLILE